MGGEVIKRGTIYYFKPALIKNLSHDIYSYKETHPTFPHQSTVDQFFDERQFEAYRELGYKIARPHVNEILEKL